MPEITPLRPGDPERLGPYRLLGLLGEGGQGSVYLGEESPPHESAGEAAGGGEAVGRKVAVKLLHARLSGDARARARFAAELEVARRVAAFCTAPILDADVEGDRPYIVSEYIDGPPLSEVLAAEGPRSGADLDRLAIGTITALAAIHEAGVVHRDFKPANVLLAPDGPRVIDFGIARALDATGTMSSTAVGTPAYMAPEQITGGPIGPQADIFAWGSTMAFAASGRPAFGRDSIPAVMHRILNLPPDLGTLNEPLRGLVQACLNKQASLRPSSQQVLIHLLNLAGSLPQAPPDGRPETQTSQARSEAMLNQGAEAAATHTGIRLVSPSQGVAPAPQPAVPSPEAYAPPPYQQPNAAWAPAPPQQHPYQQPPTQQPTQPPPQQWALPGTWPGTTPPPGKTGPSGGSRKRGLGVLAGAGSAALVALVLAGSVIVVQLQGDDKPSKGGKGGTGRTGGELRLPLYDTVAQGGGLSPSNAGFGTERIVAKQVFTGLVEFTSSGTLRNRLAAKITPDAGCTSWRIDLRSGTTFSNGERVTPESFIRGWVRAAQDLDGTASLAIGEVKGFQEARSAKGSTTMSGLRSYGTGFSVDLTSADCEFDRRLADPVLSPVPSNAGGPDDAVYNERPIGNGPFKVESYVKGSRITLVRNDTWAFGKTKLDRVVIDLDNDMGAKGPAGYKAGRYHWAPLESMSVGTYKGDPGLLSRPGQGLNFLIPITARGPMSTKEARLAVSHALDRKALSDQLYGGALQPARGIVPAGIAGTAQPSQCPSCERPDPAEAKRLASAAKVGPGTRVRLYVRNLPVYVRWAQLVEAQLERNLGWSVDLRVSGELDYVKFAKEVTSKDAFGLATFAWQADFPSAHNLLRSLLGSGENAAAGSDLTNLSGWRNGRFDQLLADIPRTADPAARLQRAREAEKIALDEMALIPVTDTANSALRSDTLVGLDMDHQGDPTLSTAAFK
ncbi:ABC transporter substrate-binding protein [Actinomadura viridis]|uniref:ABC transporter substrate-binding protein n=1 Tax=Actinomadura viridis TaxID=58110 RepID=UPI00367661A6